MTTDSKLSRATRPVGYSVSHLDAVDRIAELERMLQRERAKAKRHRTRLADVTTRMATEWVSLINEGMEQAWDEGKLSGGDEINPYTKDVKMESNS